MKTSISIATAIVLSVTTALAQNNPPTPPGSSTSSHSDSESSTSYSYTVNDDDDSGGNVSISTSSTDDSYSFRLKYDGSKDDQIKDLLYKEMGTNNLTKKKGSDVWVTKSGGEEVYEIKFSKGKLRMELDKEIASETLTKKIEGLGKEVRKMISGNNGHKREAERLQREADRLGREADRMRREADRLRDQEERNADRINREADRLTREANRLADNVRRSGGVSEVVNTLLKDNKTLYDGIDKGTTWVLPKLLPLLTKQLRKDGLLAASEDINLLNEEDGLFVNGQRVSRTAMGAYNTLFRQFGIRDTNSFSLNKTKNHIVLIDNSANLDKILFTLKTANIITKNDTKVLLELNGNSVLKNGMRLSANQTKVINELLLIENVIPAPGKTLSIKNEDNYSLGYSMDKGKTHLGTWVMND